MNGDTTTGNGRNGSLWRRAWRRGRRVLIALGIDTLTGSRWHVRLRPRFFYLVLSLMGCMALGTFGLAAYSTSPSFCRSCHIMEPYYQAWSQSKHKDVACVECHYPPGHGRDVLWRKFQALSQVVKFVTRTYSSKPYAEVEDASCLRQGCHATRLLQGRLVTERGVLFDHRHHLEGVRYGRQLRCASCHSQVVVGKHIEVTYDTCYLCHLKGHKTGRDIRPMGGCQGCHQLPDKEIKVGNIHYNHKSFLGSHDVACQSCHQDVVVGEGNVPKDRCTTCHNQPEKLARYGEIAFLHDNHVTKHSTACFHCHVEIRHGATPAGTKKLNYGCDMCHTDMHDLQRNMYRGIGTYGVPPMPSPMYLSNVDCVGCHVAAEPVSGSASRARTFPGSEKGCRNCHGPEYTGILEQVKGTIFDAVTRLRQKADTIRIVSNARPSHGAEIAMDLEQEIYNLDFVAQSHAVHNIYYAAQVLAMTDAKLTELATKAGVTTEDTSGLPMVSGAYCATTCHPRVGVRVPCDTVTYRGKTMPHKAHYDAVEGEGLACTACHVFGNHKEIKLKQPAICGDCH